MIQGSFPTHTTVPLQGNNRRTPTRVVIVASSLTFLFIHLNQKFISILNRSIGTNEALKGAKILYTELKHKALIKQMMDETLSQNLWNKYIILGQYYKLILIIFYAFIIVTLCHTTMFDYPLKMQIEDEYVEEKARHILNQSITALTTKSPSNQQIAHHNAQIIKILKHPESFDLLINSIIEHNHQQNKVSILISFISHFLKNRYNKNVILGPASPPKNTGNVSIQVLNEKLMKMFLSSYLSHRNKELLLTVYTRFIGKLAAQFIKIRQRVCNFIIDYFVNDIGQNWGHSAELQNYFYLIKAVLATELQTDSYRKILEKLLLTFIGISASQLQTLNKTLMDYMQKNHHTEEENQNIQIQVEWTYRVQLITQLLYTKASVDRLPYLKEQAYLCPQFGMLMVSCLDLQISYSNKKQLFFPQDDKITQIKISGMKIFRNTLEILYKKRKQLNKVKYIGLTEICNQFIYKYFGIICVDLQDYPARPLTDSCEQLLKIALISLEILLKVQYFMNHFIQNRNKIIINICLPCLVIQDKHLEMNPEDFCQFKEDIIAGGYAKNLYEACIKVIQAYSDRIDGTLKFIYSISVSMVDYALTADPVYCKQFPQQLMNSHFFQKLTHFQQIQVSLTILSSLAYFNQSRKDIIAAVNSLFIRRQQFFSKIDLPPSLLSSFFICVGYYTNNIFDMIVENNTDKNFYLALGFHCIEVVKVCINFETGKYFNSDCEIIASQALDLLQNYVTQAKFMPALFPQWQANSPENLLNFFDKLCYLLIDKNSLNIIDNILIDFYREAMRRHKDQPNYEQMPKIMKADLAYLLANKFPVIFSQQNDVFKAKILELFHILMIIGDNPEGLVYLGQPTFVNIIDVNFSFLEQVLEIYQTLIRRSFLQKFTINENLMQYIFQTFKKSVVIIGRQNFETVTFDAIFHMIRLQYKVAEVNNLLHSIFLTYLSQKDVNEDAEIIMEKTVYLLIIHIYLNGYIGSYLQWKITMDAFIDYLRQHYRLSNSRIVGKVVCFCVCCYDIYPLETQATLGTKISGFWDCALDDTNKYESPLQKKIMPLKLLSLFLKNPSTQPIQANSQRIIQSVAQIIFYHYQKETINWFDDDSDDDQENLSEQSEEKSQKFEYVPAFASVKRSQFLNSLPNQLTVFRDVCHSLINSDRAGFSKFVSKMPIAIQNMIRNKILNYQEKRIGKSPTDHKIEIDKDEEMYEKQIEQNRQASGMDSHNYNENKNKKKLRTFLKVKKQY